MKKTLQYKIAIPSNLKKRFLITTKKKTFLVFYKMFWIVCAGNGLSSKFILNKNENDQFSKESEIYGVCIKVFFTRQEKMIVIFLNQNLSEL